MDEPSRPEAVQGDSGRHRRPGQPGASTSVEPRHEFELPRILYWKSDLCAMLGVKLRTLERMIATGEVPRPDRRLRGRPCWRAVTIHEWESNGCPPASESAKRISA